jgi:hypothetical protein
MGVITAAPLFPTSTYHTPSAPNAMPQPTFPLPSAPPLSPPIARQYLDLLKDVLVVIAILLDNLRFLSCSLQGHRLPEHHHHDHHHQHASPRLRSHLIQHHPCHMPNPPSAHRIISCTNFLLRMCDGISAISASQQCTTSHFVYRSDIINVNE